MRQQLAQLRGNSLVSGSLVMFVGSNFYNFSQFIFHFLSGRILGQQAYGDLATIISLLGVVGIIQLAMNLSIVRFIARCRDTQRLGDFISWIVWWSVVIASVLLLVDLLITPLMVGFFNLSEDALGYLFGLLLFLFIIVSNSRSVLQGLTKFGWYSASLSVEGVVKIVAAVAFLGLGYQLIGAMWSLIVSVMAATIFSLWSIRGYLRLKLVKISDVGGFFKYSGVTLVQGLALTSMFTTDLLLVKHYFSPTEAGTYAALAILGRIVFFGVSPISQVMFPLVAKRHFDNQPHRYLFYYSALAVVAIGCGLTSVYYLFPELVIGLMFGQAFLGGSSILWWFALSLGLLGFASLCLQFYLSIGKTSVVWVIVAAALLQAGLIGLYHQSLLQVVQMSALSSSLLLAALLLYFPYHYQRD